MKMRVSEVAHYEHFEYKIPLCRRLWRWLLCGIKGHTTGIVYMSSEGVWELCGRCGKTIKIGEAIKREPQVLYFSKILDPLKYPGLQSPHFREWFPPDQDNTDETRKD